MNIVNIYRNVSGSRSSPSSPSSLLLNSTPPMDFVAIEALVFVCLARRFIFIYKYVTNKTCRQK